MMHQKATFNAILELKRTKKLLNGNEIIPYSTQMRILNKEFERDADERWKKWVEEKRTAKLKEIKLKMEKSESFEELAELQNEIDKVNEEHNQMLKLK